MEDRTGVEEELAEQFDLAGVNVLRLRQSRQELVGYLLLKSEIDHFLISGLASRSTPRVCRIEFEE
jgi:hypothetical protein